MSASRKQSYRSRNNNSYRSDTRTRSGLQHFQLASSRFFCSGAISTTESAGAYKTLFADAELAKDHIEQIFRSGFAHDLANRIDGDVQVHSDQVKRMVGAQRFKRSQRGLASALESVLVPRVDHHLEHFGLNLPGPGKLLNGVFEEFDPLSRQAANINDRRV